MEQWQLVHKAALAKSVMAPFKTPMLHRVACQLEIRLLSVVKSANKCFSRTRQLVASQQAVA